MLTGTLSPASNRATWVESYQLIDDEADGPVDISAATEIIIEVRDHSNQRPLLSGSLTGGQITMPDDGEDGVFQWRFESSQMRCLCPKTYDVFMRMTHEGDDIQLFIGYLPVLEG